MTKAELRIVAKDVRAAFVSSLTSAERCAAAIMLAENVMTQLNNASVVAVYLPINNEADTLPLIDRLAGMAVQIALPHVGSRQTPLRFLEWSPGDPLVGGPLGLWQPDPAGRNIVPDVIVTPLLAFDVTLNRLGYGAGYYDRAFAALPEARRIGVAWSVQQVDHVVIEPWDIPLHGIATEKEWISG